jgi:hypothetical protein
MDFKQDEIDLVHTMWTNETQDEDVISSESGIKLDRVIGILNLLSEQGKIKDFLPEEKEVISFKEMLDLDEILWEKKSIQNL